jgi:hypothetical protein
VRVALRTLADPLVKIVFLNLLEVAHVWIL